MKIFPVGSISFSNPSLVHLFHFLVFLSVNGYGVDSYAELRTTQLDNCPASKGYCFDN